MHASETRILTTHTGSLPRPEALVRLYVAKNRGEPVDVQLAEAGHAALEDVVRKQRDAGIDVGNNGEQQREAFFLYVRTRMSGFGGAWTRPPRADVERYPAFKAAMQRDLTSTVMVSSRDHVPTATGEVRYLDRAAIDAECTDFRATLDKLGNPFVEPFLTAPSPGIVAAALRNDHYPSEDAYLAALGEALRVEYEAIVRHGFLLQLDCPDLAMERHMSYQPGHSAISWASSIALSPRSMRRSSTYRARRSACMRAGATTRGRTTATSSCRRSCRSCAS